MHRFFPKKRNTVSVFFGKIFFDGTDLKGALTARVSLAPSFEGAVGSAD